MQKKSKGINNKYKTMNRWKSGEGTLLRKNDRMINNNIMKEGYSKLPSHSCDEWQKQHFLITDPQHECQIRKLMELSASGFVSICRVKSLSVPVFNVYPKKSTMLIETLKKKFTEICSLSFPEVLYLLKETFLGFSSLLKHFGPVRIERKHCGLNMKGQCRIWTELRTPISLESCLASSIEDIFRVIFTLMKQLIKSEELKFLLQFQSKIYNKSLLTPEIVYLQIEKIEKEWGIHIPKFISLDQTVQIQETKLNNRIFPMKIEPIFPNSVKNINPLSARKGQQMFKGQNCIFGKIKAHPKVTWKYSNAHASLIRNQSVYLSNHKFECSDIKQKKGENDLSPLFKKQKTQNNTIAIPLNISQQYTYKIEPEALQQGFQMEKDHKGSLATTQVMSSKNNSCIRSRNYAQIPDLLEETGKEEEQKLNSDRNAISIVVEDYGTNKSHDQVKSNYNFGGVIDVGSISRIHEELESILQAEVEIARKGLAQQASQMAQSIYIHTNPQLGKKSNEFLVQSRLQNSQGWKNSIKFLLKASDLKESICYLEEKQQPKELNLSKIGHLGRPVAHSIIPTD